MKIIGTILLVLILGLYAAWMWYTKNKAGVSGKTESGVRIFDIVVKGVYSPSVIAARKGERVKIRFRREESADCSRFVNFPDFHIRKELPEGETVEIELTPERAGEYMFTCDMSMYQGKLVIT